MSKILFIPPLLFVILLVLCALASHGLSRCACKVKSKIGDEGRGKPYACGEEGIDHTPRPDYSEFFPFAFFFTILHVVALVVATIPGKASVEVIEMCFFYMIGAAAGLRILLRKAGFE